GACGMTSHERFRDEFSEMVLFVAGQYNRLSPSTPNEVVAAQRADTIIEAAVRLLDISRRHYPSPTIVVNGASQEVVEEVVEEVRRALTDSYDDRPIMTISNKTTRI